MFKNCVIRELSKCVLNPLSNYLDSPFKSKTIVFYIKCYSTMFYNYSFSRPILGNYPGQNYSSSNIYSQSA